MQVLVGAVLFILVFSSVYIKYSNSYTNSYCVVALDRRRKTPALANIVALLLLDRAFQSLFLYRINHRINRPLIGRLLTNLGYYLTGIEIYYNARIGRRVQIWHGQGTVIGQKSIIGDDCLLLHQVTLGSGHVELGNGVKVGTGAKLLGTIKIGDYSIIGSNAVVTRDIPANSVVRVATAVASIDPDADYSFGTKRERKLSEAAPDGDSE